MISAVKAGGGQFSGPVLPLDRVWQCPQLSDAAGDSRSCDDFCTTWLVFSLGRQDATEAIPNSRKTWPNTIISVVQLLYINGHYLIFELKALNILN